MNKPLSHHPVLIAVVAFLMTAFVLGGCKEKKEDSHAQPAVETEDTDGNDSADSRSNALDTPKDLEGRLAMFDSLELAGSLTAMQANERRANAYAHAQQKRTAEFYFNKNLTATPTTTEDSTAYCESAGSMANLYVNRSDYDRALQVALPAIAMMRKMSKVKDPILLPQLLESLGRCQLSLNRDDEAAATYDEAYRSFLQNYTQAEDKENKVSYLYHSIISTHNASLSYIKNKRYAQSQLWTERTDSLLTLYEALQADDESFIHLVQARLLLHQAIACQGLGKAREAARAYQDYQETDYGKSPDGRIDATPYLVAAKRFDEAADNYRDLDKTLHSWGVELSFNNIERYLFPKYRANVSANRKDSAIATGILILNLLDTAIVRARDNDAAELATIYSTQQKETEIANQKSEINHKQAELTRQRLVGTVLTTILLVIFFTIYTLYRRRAQQRLAVANGQLQEAYAKLETMNQELETMNQELETMNQELETMNQELERKNGELTVARQRSEEASQMKSNFIRQISHEIRTPLNILSGFTQIITTPGMELDEATLTDIRQNITANTDRITEVVNKMLELSDASSTSVIDCDDLVTAAQVGAQAIYDSNIGEADHLVFDMQFDDGDLLLKTNLKAATRALTLLLDNARKFTKPAEAFGQSAVSGAKEHATLAIRLKGDTLHFIVEDTGIGVPPEDAGRIFDEFVQADDYYDGTGIGLTVARSLARRMGGDVVLDTSYTGGARFIMTLPYVAPQD